MQKQEAPQAKLLQLESELRQLANLDRKMPLGLGLDSTRTRTASSSSSSSGGGRGGAAPAAAAGGGREGSEAVAAHPAVKTGQLVRLVQYRNAMSSLGKPVLPGGLKVNKVQTCEKTCRVPTSPSC